MTKMLEKAISKVKQLSEADQNAITQLVLDELEERRLEASFANPKSPALPEKPLTEAGTQGVIVLVGTLDYDKDYGYKEQRNRH